MFTVAHRTPLDAAECAAVATSGASFFELDVQLSPRGAVVSHYLPLLGIPRWLQNDNWSFRWHTRAHRDPTVLELVANVPPGCRVLLDPKEATPERRRELVAALRDLLIDRDRYVVSTNDPEDLARYRGAGFTTWRTVKNPRELAALFRDGELPDAGVSIRQGLLTARVIERLQGITSTVVAWTVNYVPRARRLAELGVSGITTDSRRLMEHVRDGAVGT